MPAEAPQIDHPQVRSGRLTHCYSPQYGWEFDLDKLPSAFQDSRVSLSQLLNPDQGWRAEGFRKPGVPGYYSTQPEFHFVFHTSTPPIRHERGFLLGRVSRLDLTKIFNQGASIVLDPCGILRIERQPGNAWKYRHLEIEPIPIGPFLTPESLEQSVVPFTVGEIKIRPFRLFDAKSFSLVGGEDPTRMVFEVRLQKPEDVINTRIVLRREGWLRQAIELLTARQPNGLVHMLNIEANGLPSLSSLAALEAFDRKLLERLRRLPSPM